MDECMERLVFEFYLPNIRPRMIAQRRDNTIRAVRRENKHQSHILVDLLSPQKHPGKNFVPKGTFTRQLLQH